MKIYADSPAHRARQTLGDLLVLVWVAVWVRIALVVHDSTLKLGTPGERISEAGHGMADGLREAGGAAAELPVVGDDVRGPFDGAGAAAEQLAGAGDAQVEAVTHLAFWLGLAVGAIPILIVLGFYLPLRIRFAREATAGQRFIDDADDLDLFALRAMARQPMHRLARISSDPAGAWRQRDAAVIRALAELELKDAGLGTPPG